MQPTRLFEIIDYQILNYPQERAITHWNGTAWKSISIGQIKSEYYSLANGLIKVGVRQNEKVGIVSQIGSPAWTILDLALQVIGAIPVPLHASASSNQISYILKDAEVSLCFAADAFLAEKIQKVDPNINVYLFSKNKKYNHWEKLRQHPTTEEKSKIDELKAAVLPDDLATIIYTSGTTGDPKGVMLSHSNILSNINSTIVLIPIHSGHVTLSYLPLSHIFERMVIYTYLMAGANIQYVRSTETILEDIQFHKPHYFTSVPRLLERVHEKLLQSPDGVKGLRRKLLKWAIKLGGKPKGGIRNWFELFFADILVYRHWRKLVYGLTETSPVISFNRFEPGGNQFGTVGIPIPGVEIKIDSKDGLAEGEVMVKGPNVMMGYYKLPEVTAKVIDSEGWFRTGDTGHFIRKHFLQLTGRKKDIFKTTTGKYVAPFHVENVLKSNLFISQCMVLGAGKPHPGTLIIPNFYQLERWCSLNNVHWTAPQFMVINPKVIELFKEVIQKLNKELSKEEKVRQFFLLHNEWSIPTGEYGPTLKLLRNEIKDKYNKEIEKLFSSKDNVVSR